MMHLEFLQSFAKPKPSCIPSRNIILVLFHIGLSAYAFSDSLSVQDEVILFSPNTSEIRGRTDLSFEVLDLISKARIAELSSNSFVRVDAMKTRKILVRQKISGSYTMVPSQEVELVDDSENTYKIVINWQVWPFFRVLPTSGYQTEGLIEVLNEDLYQYSDQVEAIAYRSVLDQIQRGTFENPIQESGFPLVSTLSEVERRSLLQTNKLDAFAPLYNLAPGFGVGSLLQKDYVPGLIYFISEVAFTSIGAYSVYTGAHNRYENDIYFLNTGTHKGLETEKYQVLASIAFSGILITKVISFIQPFISFELRRQKLEEYLQVK